ncbi:hypothetical protein CSB45_05315 [candidate division KSB3 bacterium]|uniref:Uncharacterized protein n=1 Tax=candidate division KSB3 bacterium TaxID=2044937 RepID=A0A2G6E855_9BACT|nr:MAG: hypothetical protein CSB45_05315 [candidate division KSB3 bacterium]PIE30467.1 MAG: hypothetical protein CSA57_04080 [candidate division KSB3 bacterium]
MNTRRILFISGIVLFLLAFLFLSKIILPPPPVTKQLSDLLPDSPLFYLHCSDLQARFKDFTQHEQYQRLFTTPYVQGILQRQEGQAQLAAFQGFLDERLLSPMQFIGKDLACALYQHSSALKAREPAVIVLSRVSRKAKLAERVFYAFNWLTEIRVEKLPRKRHNHPVYHVNQQDLPFPLYYTLFSDLVAVSSSLDLLETVIERLSQEAIADEPEAFHELVRHTQPEISFLTAFVDPPRLAEELSSNLFFRSWSRSNQEQIELLKDAPPLLSIFDIYEESVRLQAEFSPLPNSHADVQDTEQAAPANSCWNKSSTIREFPLLLDLSPNTLSKLFQRVREIFPPAQLEWQHPLQGYRLWENTIECRMSTRIPGTLYALPDLLCIADSPVPPEESAAAVTTIVSTLLKEELSPMLRRTMLRHARKIHQHVPVSVLKMLVQEVMAYAALSNRQGKAFTMLSTNSRAIEQAIDATLAEADALPVSCTNSAPDQHRNSAQQFVPGAGLWIHADRLAAFIKDFSQSKSFRLLVPRKAAPEFYAQLPELLVILQSLPPLYLELGLQRQTPTARLWSKGYVSAE